MNLELRIWNGIQDTEFRKITKFTGLIVWQEGYKLVLLIYKAAESFPGREKYCLSDQLRRVVVSFTSNTAEGFAKRSSKEKNIFYSVLQTS